MSNAIAKRLFLLICLGVTVWAWTAPAQRKSPGPPKTRVDNVTEVLHGVSITDPYRWLEDQDSPETRAWIDAQNAYSRPLFDAIPGRDAIRRRLTELMKVDSIQMPIVRNGRYFFSKRIRDQELDAIYMRRGFKGQDEILLDPHPLSPDHRVSVALAAFSEDGSTIAYLLRRGGEDEITIKLLGVDSKSNLPDQFPKARYRSFEIKPDNSGIYYTRVEKEGPRAYYHRMGAPPANDKLIFGEGIGPEKLLFASLSEDGRYLLFHVRHGVGGAARTEIYCQNLKNAGPVLPIVTALDANFRGFAGGNTLFLHTNWKAPKWRILAVDLRNPARENWQEVIPEGPAVINNFTLAGGKLCISYLENVVSRVKIFEAGGKHVRDIMVPALGTVTSPFGRWSSDEAFYLFESFHMPSTIFRYSVGTGKQEIWSRLSVPVNSADFDLKQVWFQSRDRTKVPMFLLSRKGLRQHGARSTLLEGYGGFNSSRTPLFNPDAVFWAERGGTYAVASLRGGGEFGESWHEAGMLEKKQNVFDDFIAAANWLIANHYTAPSKLAISGISNGGLLVGAALTQRPDLFGAVLCAFPLLDMVRYHKFLVGRLWVPEYGSADNPTQFRYLHAYSPYHRVRPDTKYPAVLFVTGDSDTRVAPLHARKTTARLQAASSPDRPILLKYETQSGHSGAKPLRLRIEDSTDELGFLLWQLGELAK